MREQKRRKFLTLKVARVKEFHCLNYLILNSSISIFTTVSKVREADCFFFFTSILSKEKIKKNRAICRKTIVDFIVCARREFYFDKCKYMEVV